MATTIAAGRAPDFDYTMRACTRPACSSAQSGLVFLKHKAGVRAGAAGRPSARRRGTRSRRGRRGARRSAPRRASPASARPRSGRSGVHPRGGARPRRRWRALRDELAEELDQLAGPVVEPRAHDRYRPACETRRMTSIKSVGSMLPPEDRADVALLPPALPASTAATDARRPFDEHLQAFEQEHDRVADLLVRDGDDVVEQLGRRIALVSSPGCLTAMPSAIVYPAPCRRQAGRSPRPTPTSRTSGRSSRRASRFRPRAHRRR